MSLYFQKYRLTSVAYANENAPVFCSKERKLRDQHMELLRLAVIDLPLSDQVTAVRLLLGNCT